MEGQNTIDYTENVYVSVQDPDLVESLNNSQAPAAKNKATQETNTDATSA